MGPIVMATSRSISTKSSKTSMMSSVCTAVGMSENSKKHNMAGTGEHFVTNDKISKEKTTFFALGELKAPNVFQTCAF